jgi:hypothetical protein
MEGWQKAPNTNKKCAKMRRAEKGVGTSINKNVTLLHFCAFSLSSSLPLPASSYVFAKTNKETWVCIRMG